MSSPIPQLALVAVLVLVNAAFAGTELALISLRETQLQRLEQRSTTGALLARLARDPNRFLATIQIGITVAGFLASAAAAISLAEPMRPHLRFLGGAAEPVAVVGVTIALAYITLVLGELAPKRIALERAERWGLLAARPLAAMLTVTRPAVWLLSRSTDVVVRLLGVDSSQRRDDVSEEELRDLVAAQPHFTPQQRLIIDGAFEISDRTLMEVLRPRGDLFVLDAATPSCDGLAELAASGHSRAPVVVGGSLDEVIGVVHLRDLLDGGTQPLGERARETLHFFPESAGVLDVLHELQTRRVQMALVIDEHGSTAGLVTMEDLVEELVGEIYDETDRDVLTARREPDGSQVVAGRFPIHDLADIGVDEIPDGPYATVAGLVLDQLGRLPELPGDQVMVGSWIIEVTGIGRRAITEVRIRPRQPVNG
jgi:putative hemolysin